MQRSLTLVTQKTDGTLNSDQTDSIDNELSALNDELINIKARTKFQGGSDAVSVFDASGNISVDTGSGSATDVSPGFISDVSGNYLTSSSEVSDIVDLITENATNRGALGAAINSLNYAVDNMQTLSNNLADGISRIVDTDYAAETANLTKSQILQQAATSMLAQANQMPNVILTLLK